MSRFYGNDSTTCGTVLLPCRTISFAIHQASEDSIIYLDGTNTSKNPYSCRPVNIENPDIHLTKSVSFIGIRSRAYISCRDGNQWFVNGVGRKDGLRVSFCDLAFRNASLRFFDVLLNISDGLFEDSEFVTVDFTIFNLSLFNLNLNGVTFQHNKLCISVQSMSRVKIFLGITNSTFIQNGNFSSSGLPSILWLTSDKSEIDIRILNCSFQKNKFNGFGMIFVENREGSTALSLDRFIMEDNGHGTMLSGIRNGLLFLLSAQATVNMDHGFVYRTYGTVFNIIGQSSKVNISNIEVDGFYSPDAGGGVVNINSSVNCLLSIEDSCFRNGEGIWDGGAVSIIAGSLKLTIQNTTFKNISNEGASGGVVYIDNLPDLKSTDHTNDFVVQMNVTNSSFIDNRSTNGGAVCLLATNLIANITRSVFVRNSAAKGGALYFASYGAAKICLHNVNFLENSVDAGGIFETVAKFAASTFNVTTNDVWFVKNKMHSLHVFTYGILYFRIERPMFTVTITHTRFVENTARRSATIHIFLLKGASPTKFHLITLDKCLFRNNAVGFAFVVLGQATMICKHLTFDSNSYFPCRSPVFSIYAKNNSSITLTNSSFVNNSCGAILVRMSTTSHFTIENSMLKRNSLRNGSGATMTIDTISDQGGSLSEVPRRTNVFMRHVRFQENKASRASIMSVLNTKLEMLNCIFLNNFAHFQGGQIVAYGTTNLKICHSVFKSTQQTILSNNEFTAAGFLRIHSSGEFILRNTSIDSNTLSEEPLILVSKARRVKFDKSSVTTCPLGSAVKKTMYFYRESGKQESTALGLFCRKCGYNLYSLQRGHAEGLRVNDSFKCNACPRGAYCRPGIKSKSNFWGYSTCSNPPTLAFTICPFGYCKSPQQNSSSYNECQGKRTGVMCGMCAVGYTEALLSTSCTSNKDCNDLWFWIVFSALVVSMAILLVFKPPFVTYSLKQVLWLKTCSFNARTKIQIFEFHDAMCSTSSDEEGGLEDRALLSQEQVKREQRQFSRFLEIVFYFYQIAQLLLSSYSLSEFFGTKFLLPVLGFFNFEPSLYKQGSLCPFPGLTPKTKLLFKIVPVIGTIIAIFILYFLNLFINKLRGTLRPSASPYLQASIKTILLGYVTLATVSISLIRCISVAGETRWFYNGNVICYRWWQYASFFFSGFYVIPFIFILAWTTYKIQYGKITVKQFLLAIAFPLPVFLLWLFRSICPSERIDIEEESENFNALKEMLLGPYKKREENASKPGAIYWQSVLIARRFVLVLVYGVVTEPSTRLFCMTLVCVLVLCCHLMVKPFRNRLANNLETLFLLFLVILGLINLFKSVFVGLESNIQGSLITVFKVFEWMEIVILGLIPCLLSILTCFAILSLAIRIMFTCSRFLLKCLFRRPGQRWN